MKKGDLYLALVNLRAALDLAEPEPIGAWMRRQGFPPESCLLVLPETMRAEVGPLPPRYVRFLPWLKEPILCRDLFNIQYSTTDAPGRN